MATYGSGLRISAAVSANRSSTGTIYTPGALQYAWLNWAMTVASSASGTIEMGGVAFISKATAGTFSSMGDASLSSSGPFVAGPSQAINTTISGTVTVYLVGVLFSN